MLNSFMTMATLSSYCHIYFWCLCTYYTHITVAMITSKEWEICQVLDTTKSTWWVEGNYGSLLGYSLTTTLGHVKIINQVSDLKTKYPKFFEGIGKYKGAPIKLHINESIRPLKRDIEEHHFIFARNKGTHYVLENLWSWGYSKIETLVSK
jgi:hypothetical protein